MTINITSRAPPVTLTILFYIKHLFAYSWMFKQIYLPLRYVLPLYVRLVHAGVSIKVYSTFLRAPKRVRHYQIFCVISRTFVVGKLIPIAEMQPVYSTVPADWPDKRKYCSLLNYINNNKMKIRRCICCNGYCRWKWKQWLKFKSRTRLYTFPLMLIHLVKVTNPIIIHPVIGKY